MNRRKKRFFYKIFMCRIYILALFFSRTLYDLSLWHIVLNWSIFIFIVLNVYVRDSVEKYLLTYLLAIYSTTPSPWIHKLQ